jgi:hypothetical protein
MCFIGEASILAKWVIGSTHFRGGGWVPLQARSAGGARKLSFPDYVTMAQDGGNVFSLKHRQFYLQEILLVLISVRG